MFAPVEWKPSVCRAESAESTWVCGSVQTDPGSAKGRGNKQKLKEPWGLFTTSGAAVHIPAAGFTLSLKERCDGGNLEKKWQCTNKAVQMTAADAGSEIFSGCKCFMRKEMH